MTSDAPLLFVPVGDNPARPFGMGAKDRACRLATNAGFECAETVADERPALLASMAYGWDPAWIKEMRNRPRSVLTLGGKPVMEVAHCLNGGARRVLRVAHQPREASQGVDDQQPSTDAARETGGALDHRGP